MKKPPDPGGFRCAWFGPAWLAQRASAVSSKEPIKTKTTTALRRIRPRTLSQPADDLAPLPDAASDLECHDVERDQRDAQDDQRPAVGDARRGDAEPGERSGGERDEQAGELLARA